MIWPGNAPVSSPFSSSTMPLTITLSMPTASRLTCTPPAGKVEHRLALDQNANLQSNFVALPCDETEHRA